MNTERTIPPAEIGLRANYKFIRADQWDIARAVQERADKTFWTVREAYESLQEKGEAVKIWLEILKQGIPGFARVSEAHNLVPALLRNSLATLISGTTVAPTFKANYLALGDGETSPASGDTTLENETLRSDFDDRSAEENTAYLNVFFPAVDVGGNTYEEAGIFVDGTGSADTGYLLSRVLLEVSLAAAETLTINASITVNAA